MDKITIKEYPRSKSELAFYYNDSLVFKLIRDKEEIEFSPEFELITVIPPEYFKKILQFYYDNSLTSFKYNKTLGLFFIKYSYNSEYFQKKVFYMYSYEDQLLLKIERDEFGYSYSIDVNDGFFKSVMRELKKEDNTLLLNFID
jgi:hypothetical protein